MSYLYHNKGVYTCNGKRFASKLEAILEANHSQKWVEWDYHHDIFGRHDWSVEPTRSLAELYRDRAQQIRDAYDRVVLFFSGGVDSWTILKTFVANDIKLDEIYIWGAFKAEEQKIQQLGSDQRPGYYTREIYSILPLVRRLVDDRGVKINLYDWTEDILNGVNDLDWFWKAGLRFGPDVLGRFHFHKKFKEHNRLLNKGQRVGYVYGIDKPRLIRDDRSIYFAFLDLIMTTGNMPTNDILGEHWENDEYFYWSPNMPELTIKQCHTVANWLRRNDKVDLIRTTVGNLGAWHDRFYYHEVNKAIYADWDMSTWQISKPTGPIYNEMSKWFLDDHLQARMKWESSLWEIERQIGKQWMNNNTIKDGLRGHLSKFYKICDYQS